MNTPITQTQFKEHCKENQVTADQLKRLMPLADLIPTLKEIVEEKKSMTFVGKKILKIIGYAAAVVGLMISIIELYKRVK
jgi:hypothetical protein